MLSRNEWDPLQHVIVGRADGAQVPGLDISLRTINYSHVRDTSEIPQGPYPQQVIDEANQDLDVLVRFLLANGVRVSRPDDLQHDYYLYCPRDNIVFFEDLVLESPMPLRCRRHESRAYHSTVQELTGDFRWITVNARRGDDLYDENCVGDPDVLALTESEAAFDAANILRANDDVFYLVSNSGNRRGAALLQSLLPGRRVWPIEGIYSYMHIDSTIALLREGLMLLNPSRIRSIDQLPPPLRSWDVIWAPDPGEVPHHPGWCNSSKWVAMNVLSVTPDLCLVEENQTELARALESRGIDCALLPMRQARTLGGSFHCVTADVRRAS